MSQEISYRSAELVYREEPDGGGGILEGRMVPYGEWTEIRSSIEGHFFERVMPGALTKTIAERAGRLRVLFEHGLSQILDRQSIAAVEEIRDEADGPYYRANLLKGLPDLLLDGLRQGLYGTSIAMRPIKGDIDAKPGKSDHNPEGIEERSITEAFLREFCVVSFPAYEGATATVRSLTDDFYVARLMEHPDALLQLVRAQAETEPSHSEPASPEDQDGDTGSRNTQTETETPPTPKRDWLAPTEEKSEWRLP